MSQYGMQMPGGQLRRGASMNIYTGLLAAAAVALLGAIGMVAARGRLIAPERNPFMVHSYDQAKKSYDVRLAEDK